MGILVAVVLAGVAVWNVAVIWVFYKLGGWKAGLAVSALSALAWSALAWL